jgi:large subunit ribosomal protein L32
MAVQQRKKSKQQCRQRHAANRYKGLQTNKCSKCSAPVLPHRACGKCGSYKGKQVLDVKVD